MVVTQSNPYECWFISYESTRASTDSHQRNNPLTHVDEITHLAWLSKSNWLSATSSVSFTLNLIRWMALDWLLNRYLKPLDSAFIHSVTSEWKFTIAWWLHHVDSFNCCCLCRRVKWYGDSGNPNCAATAQLGFWSAKQTAAKTIEKQTAKYCFRNKIKKIQTSKWNQIRNTTYDTAWLRRHHTAGLHKIIS